jgi:predicted ATP-grasp superfamily ATP-dependent carboligase
MEEIGYVVLKNQQPLVAIHKDKLLKPISIYYNEKYNLIVVHAITPGAKAEWDIAEALRAIQAQTKAKKIISLEGVMSKDETSNVLYYSSDDKLKKEAEKQGLKKLDDGLVVGVTAALMSLKTPSLVALFGEVHSQLPDSGAAAKIGDIDFVIYNY